MGEMATSPLPYRGSPPLQSGGQNQKWPTSGRNGYLTPAVSGIPTASERGAESEVAHKWAKGFFLLIFLLSKKKIFFYSVSQLSRNPTY